MKPIVFAVICVVRRCTDTVIHDAYCKWRLQRYICNPPHKGPARMNNYQLNAGYGDMSFVGANIHGRIPVVHRDFRKW